MKRALLTVSFGTSYPDTRRQTIESIEQDLQKAFPDRLFARAWSSSFLRRKVKDREGVSVDSPADALRKLKEQGMEDVLVANTHLMNGEENDSLRKALLQEKDGFTRLAVARPLMAEDADIEKLAKALTRAFSFAGTNELVALMGHGSEFPMENPYLKLQEELDLDLVASGGVSSLEDVRRLRADLKRGRYVFIARPSIVDLPHEAVTREVRGALARAKLLRDAP